jgi:hypothetical protein
VDLDRLEPAAGFVVDLPDLDVTDGREARTSVKLLSSTSSQIVSPKIHSPPERSIRKCRRT